MSAIELLAVSILLGLAGGGFSIFVRVLPWELFPRIKATQKESSWFWTKLWGCAGCAGARGALLALLLWQARDATSLFGYIASLLTLDVTFVSFASAGIAAWLYSAAAPMTFGVSDE